MHYGIVVDIRRDQSEDGFAEPYHLGVEPLAVGERRLTALLHVGLHKPSPIGRQMLTHNIVYNIVYIGLHKRLRLVDAC